MFIGREFLCHRVVKFWKRQNNRHEARARRLGSWTGFVTACLLECSDEWRFGGRKSLGLRNPNLLLSFGMAPLVADPSDNSLLSMVWPPRCSQDFLQPYKTKDELLAGSPTPCIPLDCMQNKVFTHKSGYNQERWLDCVESLATLTVASGAPKTLLFS